LIKGDWSSDVCSSDLLPRQRGLPPALPAPLSKEHRAARELRGHAVRRKACEHKALWDFVLFIRTTWVVYNRPA
jgi:hypothetical protein